MFDMKIEDRLRAWCDFRNNLETEDNPFRSTVEFYNKAPLTNFRIDPYTPENYPNPWELLEENVYDEFGYILGIGYTLRLTDRFSKEPMKITITQDNKRSCNYYLLHIQDKVIGFDRENIVNENELPKSLFVESIYQIPCDY